MKSTTCPHPTTQRWLRDCPLTPYVSGYFDYLIERRYSGRITQKYIEGVAHLGRWMSQCHLTIDQLDEEAINRFLDEHLPRCDCPRPAFRSRSHLSAACAHLLRILRERGVVPPPAILTAPLDEEIDRFDAHLRDVRGLADETRRNYRRIVHRLLEMRFGTAEIVFSALQPADVRQFIADQLGHKATPSNASVIATALRAYFRYRGTCGNDVHALQGVIAIPAHWSLASLPRSLTADEIDRLLHAFPPGLPSCRRAYAMVRCALDMGLRASEIAKLALADIDWRAGMVTLRSTKSRREDILPLPVSTGQAIADYLHYERPRTTNPAVFVRRLAPHDVPIGPDAVRRLIRDAYRRIGLPHARTHALRHTLARQLLEQGSSLKEVADVLRHRSLDTSLIYAKLDSRRLAAVALPWPGSAP
ncbi:MAG: tyrosine-type recombinase/integrase [Gammaproteobacteria bacterium]